MNNRTGEGDSCLNVTDLQDIRHNKTGDLLNNRTGEGDSCLNVTLLFHCIFYNPVFALIIYLPENQI